MKKIVITGGLGYIGTELCKLYSGEARFTDITVIDKAFASDRVRQLKHWGIKYVQRSILDDLSDVLADADVVIHLAGITDVAYVKTDMDEERDKEIRATAVNGTRNVINSVKKSCKIIFPSTHVVYEGLSETTRDIDEDKLTCPVLTYAKCKLQSEIDLALSGVDYIILRLASVYGYSGDAMRLSIMPNLFSKIASQNGTIKLYSGGVQLKSLVPLIDVVRCIKFMAESTISCETFHLSKDSVTVKQVADLCKEINPKLNIVSTDDEIPNLGYTISNKKLLATGFKFRGDLRSSLEEMIAKWSDQNIRPELEYLDKGGKEFVDSRGVIRNYELTEPINLIGLIESNAGSVRANHYHPIQEQKCLLISGHYVSVILDLEDPNAVMETRLISPGDIAIIKPNVAHAMVFLTDAVFLNLVAGEREHENYGVTHTIPYTLVDDYLRNKILGCYCLDCRVCENRALVDVVSLGESPLANNLITGDQHADKFPLEMKYCPRCHNCQLSVVVPPEKMFDEYLYVSSTSPAFVAHFEKAAAKYIEEFGLNENSRVIDIGSNDGISLLPLVKAGVNVLGIEPADNIARIARQRGVDTLCLYFDDTSMRLLECLEFYGRTDLVTASNVFAHSDKLDNITSNVFKLLKEDGVFIVEVQYLLDTIKDLTFDNIYHEHVNYWSVTSLYGFMNMLGYVLYKVEHVDTHGGSIRAYIRRSGVAEQSVVDFMDDERAFGLTKTETYVEFGKRVLALKQNARRSMDALKKKYTVIAAYGSPAKATTALNFFGITSDDIAYTIEDNPLKHGKRIPGVDIPIVGKEGLAYPELVIVLAWNFFDVIVAANQQAVDAGVKFVSIKDLQSGALL
jgi:nucleoside-diphosphate-sugar epimerase/SAM-dependent methyltransferase